MEYNIPIGAVSRNTHVGNIAVDTNVLSESVTAFVFEYGLRQVLNDAVSDKTDGKGNKLTPKEILAKAQAKYDQLVAGELRKRREVGESDDPVENEAFKLAKARLTVAFKDKKVWPTKGEDKFQRALDAWRMSQKKETVDAGEYITSWLDANPGYRKQAKVNIDARNALGGSDLL